MLRYRFNICLALCALGLFSCNSKPDADDLVAIKLLEAKFSSDWVFEASDIYLKAQSRNGCPSREAAESVAVVFWNLNQQPSSRKSEIVYINYHDQRDRFVFQLAWDAATDQFVESKRQYY